jgi:hypothetical protein
MCSLAGDIHNINFPCLSVSQPPRLDFSPPNKHRTPNLHFKNGLENIRPGWTVQLGV